MEKYFTKLIDNKMMLCTRDIKVGDTCKFLHPTNPHPEHLDDNHKILNLHHSTYKPFEVRTDNGYGPKEGYFKVIGEISPEAKWIKEGDEFEEDQIRIDMIDRKFPAESHYDIEDLELINAVFIKNRPDRFYISIAVECPCCETFK